MNKKVLILFVAYASICLTFVAANEPTPTKAALEVVAFGLPDSSVQKMTHGWRSEEEFKSWKEESGFTTEYLRTQHALILDQYYTEHELREVVEFLESEGGQRFLEITASKEFGGSGVSEEMSEVIQKMYESQRQFRSNSERTSRER